MKFRALFSPYDIYERHRFIASNLSPDWRVIDVGGELKNLSYFSENKIVEANLSSGDIVYNGERLPVDDNSYEAVVSIDVLEHVPYQKRLSFIKDLVRVASQKVILSAPYGTRAHLRLEKKALESMISKGRDDKYLREHVINGLPQKNEIEKLILAQKKLRQNKLVFSGNIYFSSFLFKIHNSEIKLPVIGRLYYFLKLSFNLIVNLSCYHFAFSKNPRETTNRFYLILYN